MEVEEIQTQACKFSRVGNGRNDSIIKIGHQKVNSVDHQQYPDDDEDGELKRSVVVAAGGGGGGGDSSGGANRLRGWHHHSSRIIRVSRASGGKDRHSKVWTSKGLRDRRVRLSVTTAIQFYDLQDRLGYDQPSKAVEWLIKAASEAIAELPSLNSSFPDTPKQLSDEKRASNEQGFDSADVELDGDLNFGHSQNQHLSLSKSACSSTSETSKGSGLSLSRSGSDVRVKRVKARERARERAAKEKEKDNNESSCIAHHQNVNQISQNSSFTELLTAGITSNNNNNNNNNNNSNTSPTGSAHQIPNGEHNLFHKTTAGRHWSAAAAPPMDYFSPGLLGSSSSRTHHSSGSGFPGQIQLGNSLPHTMSMSIPPFNVSSESHQDLHPHFPFVDHLIPVTTQPGAGGGVSDYNLNFTISSSGLAGFNRGTLQSNSSSPSLLPPHLQRFASSIDGSNVPFFIGTTTPPVENHHHHHHQFPPGFDGRLQLRYGDGSSRHSDQKGKDKH